MKMITTMPIATQQPSVRNSPTMIPDSRGPLNSLPRAKLFQFFQLILENP